jgi:hypothetical protein
LDSSKNTERIMMDIVELSVRYTGSNGSITNNIQDTEVAKALPKKIKIYELEVMSLNFFSFFCHSIES